ncbi:MAG TPA: hypothetical protein VM124_02120 [Candidatus Limnocylindrales bacterium]|nr:hypothetical protein [Candidatus Limnocylindrales bacterium]
MAEAAATLQPEIYAQSLSAIRTFLGEVATGDSITVEACEAATEPAREDFITAIAEMLATDPKLREYLDIENNRSYRMRDGHAVNSKGQRIVSIVSGGSEASAMRASDEPAFEAQATRDKQDVIIAERADNLKVGTALFALSLEAKEAMQAHPETYKDELGYKEGLAYLQFYCRVDDSTLLAGSFSVDYSDKHVWQEILAEHGVYVSANESSDTWLTSTAHERIASPETAQQFIKYLRTAYYQRVGRPGQRLSVTEYVETNRQALDTIFDTYYPALSEALNCGHNNDTLKLFGQTVLQGDLSKLDPVIKQQLMRISCEDTFDEEAARTMNSVLRYVATEQLRKGLDHLTARPKNLINAPVLTRQPITFVPPDPMQLHNLLAANLRAGIEAGRSYGGCPGNIKLSTHNGLDSLLDTERRLRNSQDIYGGLAGEEENETNRQASDEDCEYISKQCPICEKKNVKTTVTKTEISGDCGCKVTRPTQTHSKLAA